MGERSVKLPPPLAEAIDEIVKRKKDEFGVPMFRSRSDFVTKACQEFLKKVSEPEEEAST